MAALCAVITQVYVAHQPSICAVARQCVFISGSRVATAQPVQWTTNFHTSIWSCIFCSVTGKSSLHISSPTVDGWLSHYQHSRQHDLAMISSQAVFSCFLLLRKLVPSSACVRAAQDCSQPRFCYILKSISSWTFHARVAVG